jgi:hypothetical protein
MIYRVPRHMGYYKRQIIDEEDKEFELAWAKNNSEGEPRELDSELDDSNPEKETK